MCLALPPAPLAPKFLSALQEVVPHSIGSRTGPWLQKELSLVPAAPDPGILLAAYMCQVSQLHGTEANYNFALILTVKSKWKEVTMPTAEHYQEEVL